MFPELPRNILAYVRFKAEEEMKNSISEKDLELFKGAKIKKGIKCNNCKELSQEYLLLDYLCKKCRRRETKKILENEKKEFKCPECKIPFEIFLL
jgi:Zn finger protein HypA/HybF involved in hydrogenase expression